MAVNEACDVLLTEAGGYVGYQVMRSLARHGLRVCVCDTNGLGPSFHSRYAAAVAVCPDPVRDEPGFVRFVASEASKRGVKAVIPIFRPEILAKHRKSLPEGVILPVDSYDKLMLLDDKVSAVSLAESLGIRVPAVISDPDRVGEWPVVFKRSRGLGGGSVYFPKDKKALGNLLRTAKPGGFLVTEYIAGYDCCVDAFRMGDVFCAWSYRVLLPKSKGMSALRVSIDAPELVAIAKSMLEAVDYNGLCGFDFRISEKNGEAYFLECNPRFSGGLGSQLASGLDLPWVVWKALCGEAVPVKQRYLEGKLSENAFVMIGLLKKKFARRQLSFREFMHAVWPFGRVFDDLDWKDLKAFVSQMKK